MAEFSDFLENEVLDHIFDGTSGAWTPSATVYLALLTATASDSNTGSTITEPSTGGYARKAMSWNAAASGSKTIDTAITFTNSAATNWPVVGIAICSALTAGDMYAFDNDMTDAIIGQNEKIQFAATTGVTVSLT